MPSQNPLIRVLRRGRRGFALALVYAFGLASILGSGIFDDDDDDGDDTKRALTTSLSATPDTIFIVQGPIVAVDQVHDRLPVCRFRGGDRPRQPTVRYGV